MGKGETQGMNAVQMATGVALGGLLALGVELILLLLGAAAVSRGILKDSAAPQLTAAACVLGCFAGGLLACARWKSRRLLGGLAAGAVCYLLILAVGLLMSEALALGVHTHALVPTRTEGMGHAEAAAGGVDTTDINPRTLESRLCPGLYFAGEVLDVTGLLGGYNLHWAWASGKAAGESWKKETR